MSTAAIVLNLCSAAVRSMSPHQLLRRHHEQTETKNKYRAPYKRVWYALLWYVHGGRVGWCAAAVVVVAKSVSYRGDGECMRVRRRPCRRTILNKTPRPLCDGRGSDCRERSSAQRGARDTSSESERMEGPGRRRWVVGYQRHV